ncbi:MAG: M56 family metallopeptidase, partial [Desulfosporosinus sp.]|nr:M56 family metallopeptidase [Desulfosporosinus sp.]
MLTLLQANYLSFFYWVLLTSVRASVFIIFLMGVKFVLRHKMGARFQYLVWLVLITGLVLPWTPASSISVNNFLNSSHLQQIITAIFGQTSQPSSTLVENKQSILDQTAVVNSDSGQAVGSTETQPAGDYIPFVYNLMFWIWLSGVLTFTVLTVLVNKRFSEKIEDDLVTDQRLLLDFAELKVKLKIKADILLLKSGNVNSPALLGLFHPRLLLPVGIEHTFSLQQVNYIFLHELLHFKRKDIWINWLTQILIISHWFNPLIWYAFYRMREDQEIACDALAIARLDTEQAQDYAYTLIKLAETYSFAPRMASLASLSGSKSQIKQRVIMISKLKQASVKWSLLGILVIGLIASATFSGAKMDANPITQGNSSGQTLEATKGVDPGSGITIEDITGPNFKGKVMLIKDPKRVKLAVSQEIGVTGERVSDLVKDTGAVAGINAGGFYDPDGKGNGAFPDGLTMHDG